MNSTNQIAAHLEELERFLLEPGVRKTSRVAELLDKDFVEIGSGGRAHSRKEILAALLEEPTTLWTASEFGVRMLSQNIALVSYRAFRHSNPPVHSLRSSIWRETGGNWQMVFHQATLSVPELGAD